jgi:hypothetical protein
VRAGRTGVLAVQHDAKQLRVRRDDHRVLGRGTVGPERAGDRRDARAGLADLRDVSATCSRVARGALVEEPGRVGGEIRVEPGPGNDAEGRGTGDRGAREAEPEAGEKAAAPVVDHERCSAVTGADARRLPHELPTDPVVRIPVRAGDDRHRGEPLQPGIDHRMPAASKTDDLPREPHRRPADADQRGGDAGCLRVQPDDGEVVDRVVVSRVHADVGGGEETDVLQQDPRLLGCARGRRQLGTA